MDQSLSVIIAAHNAQHTLGKQVVELLEFATDLTPHFEIMIVDDGSHDATEEVAYELTLRFPQVRMLRHPERLGAPAAIRSGMRETQGDIVLVQDGASPLRPSEIRRLWSLRANDDVLIARSEGLQQPRPLDPGLLKRLMAWGAKVTQTAEEQQRSGLQMIRRQAANKAFDQLEFELERVERPANSGTVTVRPKMLERSQQTTC